MTRSQVASLVAVFVAIVVGTSGAAWWRLNPTHSLPAALEKLATPAAPARPSTQTASREPSPAPPPAPSSAEPAAPPAKAEASAVAPSFDVVRVEPKGDTVVAGKGAPNTKVELMAGNRKLGEAVADSAGQFVILPPPLPPGDYDLTLRQDADGRPASSKQSVAVSVPKPGQGPVVVALAEPGKATKLLSPAPAPSASGAAALPAGKVAIRSAELENGSGFYVTGTAKAGAHVHVYLNDAHIADVVAGPDGGWNVRVRRGLTGGHYVVRADAGAGGDSRAVASRAEVPFDVPVAMAEAPKPPPAAEVASNAPAPDVTTAPSVASADSAPGASAVVDSIATARVTTGDNLWNISRYRLGDGKRYTQIYAANAAQIRNPDLIFPGQVFVVPKR